MHSIEIKTLPVYHLGALPHMGPYDEIGRVFERLGALISDRGLWPHVQAMAGVYYDDPRTVEAASLHSHAGALVDEQCPLAPPLEQVVLPGGRHAVLHHTGPYDTLPEAWTWLFDEWLPGSGEEMGESPAFELHLNSPESTAPEDLKTDICLPLL